MRRFTSIVDCSNNTTFTNATNRLLIVDYQEDVKKMLVMKETHYYNKSTCQYSRCTIFFRLNNDKHESHQTTASEEHKTQHTPEMRIGHPYYNSCPLVQGHCVPRTEIVDYFGIGCAFGVWNLDNHEFSTCSPEQRTRYTPEKCKDSVISVLQNLEALFENLNIPPTQ